MEYATVDDCKKVYSSSGWIPTTAWLRSKNGWSVELLSDYLKNPEAWLEYGAPAYTLDFIKAKTPANQPVPKDVAEACDQIKQLFQNGTLQGVK